MITNFKTPLNIKDNNRLKDIALHSNIHMIVLCELNLMAPNGDTYWISPITISELTYFKNDNNFISYEHLQKNLHILKIF